MIIKIQWTDTRSNLPAEAHIVAAAQELKDSIYTQYIQGRHIAEVVDCQEFSDLNTCDKRGFLDAKQAVDHAATKSRVLRIRLVRPFEPIIDLHGEEFRRVFWHVVHCHYNLWELGVHHRDINLSNMMYTCDGPTETVRGVLLDFDLSTLLRRDAPVGKECAGTLPFMARELLTEEGSAGEVKHIYRHDAESLIWTLFYVVGKRSVRDGCVVNVEAKKVDTWALATSHSACLAAKDRYLLNKGLSVSRGYSGLRRFAQDLRAHLIKLEQVMDVEWVEENLVAGIEPTAEQVYTEMLKTDQKELDLVLRTIPQLLQGVPPLVWNPGTVIPISPDILAATPS